MDTKLQFKQGLQWGGLAWLAHLVVSSFGHVRADHLLFLPYLIPAIAWALVFVLAWTRWSRVAVALAVVAQIGAAVAMTARMDDLRVTLAAFMPLCLPVLPLLILVPERPRLTVALALVGRWRDAARTLAGWRWLPVAIGVLLLERSGWASLSTTWSSEDWLRIPGQDVFVAFVPQVLLFGVAAFPRLRWPATA
jgi:hypothetical protein